MPTTATTADWPAVAEMLEGLGGRREGRAGATRQWRVPSPTGGTFLVLVTLRPRWCSIAVDRWRTTDRDPARAEPWFAEHVWSHVRAACKARRGGYGALPTGTGTWTEARPLNREVLLDVLGAWVEQELSWGLDRQAMGWCGR